MSPQDQQGLSSPPDSLWLEHWRSHRADIVRYATALCSGDHHAGEDIAQETAIRLWQRPWVLESEQSLRGWLRTVARNIVIDRARRRAARPREVLTVMQHEPAIEDAANTVEAELAVDFLLSGLSPAHRDALREVYARDQGVTRAAARLEIPVGTVKSRCHHALRDLRRLAAGRQGVDPDATDEPGTAPAHSAPGAAAGSPAVQLVEQ